MPGISIDRLTLDLPGMPEAQARRLALGIADGLAVAGVSDAVAEVPTLRIDLTADPSADAVGLARRIISDFLLQLRRSP